MGLATNITLFLLCLSFVFYLFGYGTLFTNMVGCVQSSGHPVSAGATCEIFGLNLYDQVTTLMVILGVGVGGLTLIAAAVAGAGVIQSVFAVLGLLLFGLVTFPVDLLNQPFVPTEIKLFLGGIFTFGYAIALMSWIGQKGTP